MGSDVHAPLEHPKRTLERLGPDWLAEQTDIVSALEVLFGGQPPLLFWPDVDEQIHALARERTPEEIEHAQRWKTPGAGAYLFHSDRNGYVMLRVGSPAVFGQASAHLPRLVDDAAGTGSIFWQTRTVPEMLLGVVDNSRIDAYGWKNLRSNASCRWFSGLLGLLPDDQVDAVLALVALREPSFNVWWQRHLKTFAVDDDLILEAMRTIRQAASEFQVQADFAQPWWLLIEHPDRRSWRQALIRQREDLAARLAQ